MCGRRFILRISCRVKCGRFCVFAEGGKRAAFADTDKIIWEFLMNIVYSVRNLLSPVRKEGFPFIAVFFVIAVALGFFWLPLFWAGAVVTLWCAYFFRDPRRMIPIAEKNIISPADGKISFIGEIMPPQNLGLPQQKMLRISIFMDIFSCHVNRFPAAGIIKSINYRKGRFFNAELDKASEGNEANCLLLQTPYGDVGVVQIAGLVARRIACWAKEGEFAHIGGRFGLIRFGSRLDVYLPLHTEICVGYGQSMIAGETVLARFTADGDNDADRGDKEIADAAGIEAETEYADGVPASAFPQARMATAKCKAVTILPCFRLD